MIRWEMKRNKQLSSPSLPLLLPVIPLYYIRLPTPGILFRSIASHTQHRPLCTLHSALCTLHSALCTLHSALCTLHSALCTLHSALCTSDDLEHRPMQTSPDIPSSEYQGLPELLPPVATYVIIHYRLQRTSFVVSTNMYTRTRLILPFPSCCHSEKRQSKASYVEPLSAGGAVYVAISVCGVVQIASMECCPAIPMKTKSDGTETVPVMQTEQAPVSDHCRSI